MVKGSSFPKWGISLPAVPKHKDPAILTKARSWRRCGENHFVPIIVATAAVLVALLVLWTSTSLIHPCRNTARRETASPKQSTRCPLPRMTQKLQELVGQLILIKYLSIILPKKG
jgi:hypothetical protein